MLTNMVFAFDKTVNSLAQEELCLAIIHDYIGTHPQHLIEEFYGQIEFVPYLARVRRIHDYHQLAALFPCYLVDGGNPATIFPAWLVAVLEIVELHGIVETLDAANVNIGALKG